MRKAFIVAGLGMILFACGGDDPPPAPPPTVDSEAGHKASERAAKMAMTSLYVEEDKDKNAVARYLTQASSEGYMTSVMPEFEKGTGNSRVDRLADFDMEILDDSNNKVVAFNLLDNLKGEQSSESLLPGEEGRTFKSHPLEKRDNDRRSEANVLISWDNETAADDPSNYLAMGYWYTKPTTANSMAQLGAFVGGTEFNIDSSYTLADEAGQGENASDVKATYEGAARGYHTSEGGETGTFSASLDLTARFKGKSLATVGGVDKDAVTIEGVIGKRGGIRFDGEENGRYELKLKQVGLSCASATGGEDCVEDSNNGNKRSVALKKFNGITTLVDKTDNEEVAGSKGSWTGLFGTSSAEDTPPDYVGGTAGVTWDDRSLLGAWIGYKQQPE